MRPRCCINTVLLSLMLMSAVVFADTPSNISATNVVASIIQILRLNIEQARQVSPLIEAYVAKKKEILSSPTPPDEQNLRIKEALGDLSAQMEHYLTKEQMAQWNIIMNQAKTKSDEAKPAVDQSNVSPSPMNGPSDDGVLQSNSKKPTGGGVY